MIKSLFERIFVAYNGSKSSQNAVMYAILMAKLYKCQVKVSYIVDVESIKKLSLTKFIVTDEAEEIKSQLMLDGERKLRYAQELAKSKGITLETQLRYGSVWSEIIMAADEFKASLILLGGALETNYFASLNKSSISNQNSEIIGSAHCSVLVVKQPYLEQLFKMA